MEIGIHYNAFQTIKEQIPEEYEVKDIDYSKMENFSYIFETFSQKTIQNVSKMKNLKGANMKFVNPNILDEGNQMEIIEDNNDILKKIVRCNNCGQPTEYGKTRMCSGFVGCDNKITVDGKEVECYWEDLMPRVLRYKNSSNHSEYEQYRLGKLYRWRDGIK